MDSNYTAFLGDKLLISGPLDEVLTRLKAHHDKKGADDLLVFEDASGRQVDFDFRGTVDDVIERAHAPAPEEPKGRGRPKLGVVSREVSLLPRHWEWLDRQPNGNSATLRRLVDEARKKDGGQERAREAREAAGRVMTVLAGNLPDFEEALRALYAKDEANFQGKIRTWPRDVKKHLVRLLEPTWG